MSQQHTTSTTFDPWFENYAARAAELSASEVRALFAVASRPEVVSLAGGMPFVSALSNDLLQDVMRQVIAEHGPVALQYGSGQGDPVLRELILDVMALEGISASVDNVVVTTGSQQAVDLVSKVFLDPGDVVLAESPSYVGAIGVFRSYQAKIVHIETDNFGLIPAAFETAIGQLRARGEQIKFLYTIPDFHNPMGVTLTWERRQQILEIAKRNHILILEDNPYGQLYFNEAPPMAIRSLDEDGIIYLGSFSKTFAPGFRVGWALAPHAIREKLILASEAAILSPSAFSQLAISTFLQNSDWKGVINDFRSVYHERKNTTIAALNEYLPQLSWTNPDGGFYVWLDLPDQIDSKSMLPRAVKELVAYTPGTAFYADGQGQDKIRLSYCYPEPARIREGIRRLSAVINSELDLLNTFQQTTPGAASRSERVIVPPPNIG